MIIIDCIEQGSIDWFICKAGVISASRASEYSTESKLAPMPDATYEKQGKEHVFFFMTTLNLEEQTNQIYKTKYVQLFLLSMAICGKAIWLN